MSRESIAGKTTWTVVLSCAVLGLVSLAIGLGVYSNQMIRMFIHHAYNTALHASLSLENGTEAEPYAKKIMEIYRSMTPEERAATGTQEYRERFSHDALGTDEGTRDTLIHILENFIMGVDDVYIAMIDEETGALVYMADPGEVDHFEPGEWEEISPKSMRTYLDWDGEGMLYDLDRSEELGWYCAAAYPIIDAAGETFAYVFVDLTLNNVIREMGGYLLYVTVGILVVSLFVALHARKRMRKDVAEPVRAISEAAEAYVRGKAEGAEDPCFAGLNIHTRDELEDLSRIMADMEETISEHEQQIKTITSQEERTKTELGMAGRIQRSMLPQMFPPFPERNEFDIFASMEPARMVGGDFYDFFLIDEDHLALLIADVSGKGIPAALFMMISEVIIKSCAMLGKSASEILTKTNEGLCSDNKVEMFVTVWLGILEISTGRITASNAGHEYPALMREGRFSLLKDKHGFVIGGMDGMTYPEYEVRLQPGDKLFLYTDGLPEASDRDNRMFGKDRMLASLNRNPGASPREILETIRHDVDEFVGDAEQFDDLTMLCLDYYGGDR